MANLLDTVRGVMSSPRGGRGPACMVCGRRVAEGDQRLRLRTGTVVHRSCATYDMRRRRTGQARLGYPRAGRD